MLRPNVVHLNDTKRRKDETICLPPPVNKQQLESHLITFGVFKVFFI